MGLVVRPLTLRQANALVASWHRHHKPVRGCRFAIGAWDGQDWVGVCIVGRPVARLCDQAMTAEVTRLATTGHANACSLLYGAAARACKALGYTRIQTYLLESEPGTSMRASGWTCEGPAGGGDWNRASRASRRMDQPMERKVRWAKALVVTPAA